jgi:hypothetical protein
MRFSNKRYATPPGISPTARDEKAKLKRFNTK